MNHTPYKWTFISQHVFKVSTTSTHTISDGHSTGQSHRRYCSVQSQTKLASTIFRRSLISWIVVSCTHCCITPQISTFKARDDPGPVRWSYDTSNAIFQFSLIILHCNITFSVFRFSQGSVQTFTICLQVAESNGISSACSMHPRRRQDTSLPDSAQNIETSQQFHNTALCSVCILTDKYLTNTVDTL